MSAYAEINIKEGMPTVEEALRYLQFSLERFRTEKVRYLLVIHSYGSTGKGEAIGQRTHKWLMAQKEKRKIKNVIFGKNFEIFNFQALELKKRCRELEPLFSVCNHGVTVVEL